MTVSYGVLMYAFPVMLVPMQAELGWSATTLTSGYSAAALVAGIVSIPVGRWLERYGPRLVMTTGSTAAVVLMLTWAAVADPVSYFVVWIGLGACMAAVFYEPAFAVIATRLRTGRARALSIVTVAGGLASTVFVPLTSGLVEAAGWRSAIVWLAVALAVLTILPHCFLPRAWRAGVEQCGPRLPSPGVTVPRCAADRVRSADLRWLAAALFLSTAASFAVAVHLIPLLLERGATAPQAASALALLGLAKVPGRAVVGPLTARWSARRALLAAFCLQIAALLLLTLPGYAWGTWLFIALFGAGEGATTPTRGELVAELFGSAAYPRIGGLLALVLSCGRFVAPVGASIVHEVLGSYDGVRWTLLGVLVAAAFAMTRLPTPRPP